MTTTLHKCSLIIVQDLQVHHLPGSVASQQQLAIQRGGVSVIPFTPSVYSETPLQIPDVGYKVNFSHSILTALVTPRSPLHPKVRH